MRRLRQNYNPLTHSGKTHDAAEQPWPEVRPPMTVSVKRVYDPPAGNDGCRVLADRLWPRGLTKARAAVDLWLKDAAPSDALRKRMHSGSCGWGEFRRAYLAELKHHREELRPLAARARNEKVTLLFGSRDEKHNNAVVLKEYLQRLGAR
jgi:uncharacterized protein YeaO (DUF488 family)